MLAPNPAPRSCQDPSPAANRSPPHAPSKRTPYDESASLSIYAKVDTVMPLLAEALEIAEAVMPMDAHPVLDPAEGSVVEEGSDVFAVPFCGATGKLDPDSVTLWDLRPGAWVKLTGGPYAGQFGEVLSKSEGGHWRIKFSR